jgi:hypothetical protein
MKGKTKKLARQVREALLNLPDKIFMKTMVEWLNLADEHLHYPEWSDEYRYALGYRVQSQLTGIIYPTFTDLHEAEPDHRDASWVVPGVETMRELLINLSIEQFYHTIIPLAADALTERATREQWGTPPSVASEGYNFLRGLAGHLEAILPSKFAEDKRTYV